MAILVARSGRQCAVGVVSFGRSIGAQPKESRHVASPDTIYADRDFLHLFPAHGKPGLCPLATRSRDDPY